MRVIICLFLCLSACGQAKKSQPNPQPTEQVEEQLPSDEPAPVDQEEPRQDAGEAQAAAAALPFPIPGIPGLPNIPGLPTNPRPVPAPTPAPAPAPAPCQVPAPTPTPAPAPQPTGQVTQLLQEINAQRQQRGLSTLTVNENLNCATAIHAKDTGNRRACTHTGADGSSPWDRIKRCGDGKTFATGEIIACGQTTPVSAVQAWIGSPGHNRIMFDAQNKRFGAAMVNNYWVVLFSKD